MKQRLDRDGMAKRAAQELKPGDYVNLGFGIPNLCPPYAHEDVVFQTENGAIGYGPLVSAEESEKADFHYHDAIGRFWVNITATSLDGTLSDTLRLQFDVAGITPTELFITGPESIYTSATEPLELYARDNSGNQWRVYDDILWESSATALRVSEQGVITGVSPGTATVTAYHKGLDTFLEITVVTMPSVAFLEVPSGPLAGTVHGEQP